MLRKTAGTLALSLLTGLIVSAPEASARFPEFHHGALCNSTTSSDAVSIAYDNFGVHNGSTTQTISVTCGGVLTEEGSQTIALTVYDRHATQDICCTGILQNKLTGATLASAQNCSTGFGSASKDVEILFPATSTAVVTLECSIPVRTSNGYSHLAFWALQ